MRDAIQARWARWKNGGMRAIAFNDTSLLTCIGNDYGFPSLFEKPVEKTTTGRIGKCFE